MSGIASDNWRSAAPSAPRGSRGAGGSSGTSGGAAGAGGSGNARSAGTWGSSGSGRSGAGGSSSASSGPSATPAGPPKIDVVQLDGLVLMKIIRHCRESLPTFVSGSLLGLDVDSSLEVTHCFPFPSSEADEDADAEYQIDMLKSLREVNVDNNQVGWYYSTYLGSYCNRDVIYTQCEFQENIGSNAVVLIYDPLRSSAGNLSLKALRLTDEFMTAHKEKKVDIATMSGAMLRSSAIFEEVPIRIHNPRLVDALLMDLAEKDRVDCDFSRLDLSSNPFLVKNLEFLIDQTDELAANQNNALYWERKLAIQKRQQEEFFAHLRAENEERVARGEDPLPEVPDPSHPAFRPIPEDARADKLDSLLISAQLSTYCDQVNSFAGLVFGKLFLTSAVH